MTIAVAWDEKQQNKRKMITIDGQDKIVPAALKQIYTPYNRGSLEAMVLRLLMGNFDDLFDTPDQR